jgi:hypothetical protein
MRYWQGKIVLPSIPTQVLSWSGSTGVISALPSLRDGRAPQEDGANVKTICQSQENCKLAVL